MGYGFQQQKMMAWEVARAGRIVAKAVQALRDEYETFRKIGDTTLRRYMRDAQFVVMVTDAEKEQGSAISAQLLERDKKQFDTDVIERHKVQTDINALRAERKRLEDEVLKLMERRHELSRT